MTSAVRRQLDSAGSVRKFAKASPSADPRHQAVEAQFEERLTTAEKFLVQQADGRLVAKKARANRRARRQELTDRCPRHLVTVAERAPENRSRSVRRLPDPATRRQNVAFLSAERSMLVSAKEESAELAKYGLGEALLAKFEKAVTDFEKLQATAPEARQSHLGATAELIRVRREIAELVGVLDGINRFRFAEQPELLARWNSARNVANPVRTKPVPPPVEGGDTKASRSIMNPASQAAGPSSIGAAILMKLNFEFNFTS